MKPMRICIILLILALLLSSISMTELPLTRAAEPQACNAHTLKPLSTSNGTDATEPLLFDFTVGEPAELQDKPFSIFSGLSASVIQPPAGNWYIETVDSKGWMGKHTSLTLDGSDRPHISYFADYPDYDLKYAWYDGAAWHIKTVDSAGDVGEYTSLALDGSDRPHISYRDSTNGALKYTWHDGTTWQVETVDSTGDGGYYTSLVLDRASRPHVSYFAGYPNYDLKYAWHDGAGWRIETVDSPDVVGGHTSLALDGSDRPHISYYNCGDQLMCGIDDLKYAWHDGTTWHIETVDSAGVVGEYTSLALDRWDRPHISYYNGYPNYDLKYAWHDGAAWHIETVDSAGDVGYHTSLALNGVDRPHITYYDYTSEDLKYAWDDGTGWQIETVDGEGSVGKYAALVLDGSGRSHISYYDKSNRDLKHAWLMPYLLILSKQATPSDGLRSNDTLTYTLTLSGPDLSVRLWDPLPRGIHYVPGSITSTITPTAAYSFTARAVVWQGTLPTDTAQTIRFQATPGITGTGSLSLSLSIVNTAWLTDTENGWSVSATVIVNGYHVYLPLVLR